MQKTRNSLGISTFFPQVVVVFSTSYVWQTAHYSWNSMKESTGQNKLIIPCTKMLSCKQKVIRYCAARWKAILDTPPFTLWNQNSSCTGWCLLHGQPLIMLNGAYLDTDQASARNSCACLLWWGQSWGSSTAPWEIHKSTYVWNAQAVASRTGWHNSCGGGSQDKQAKTSLKIK